MTLTMQLMYKNKLKLPGLYILAYFIANPDSHQYSDNTKYIAGNSEQVTMI